MAMKSTMPNKQAAVPDGSRRSNNGRKGKPQQTEKVPNEPMANSTSTDQSMNPSTAIDRCLNWSFLGFSITALVITGIYVWTTPLLTVLYSIDLHKLLPAYVLGYGISLFGGHILIFLIMYKLLTQIGDHEQANFLWQAGCVGFTERLIYTTAIVVGLSEIIAVWLVMKAAIQWKSEETKSVKTFYAYLVGNGLSLIFGLVGGGIILLLNR